MIAVGLQAGFGTSMSAEFPGIAAHGFTVVRQDLYAVDPATVPALVAECAGAPCRPLFLVGGGHIAHADGSGRLEPCELAVMTTTVVRAAAQAGLTDYAIEIGNEPDLSAYENDPEDFAEAVREAHFAARAEGFQGLLISGGIANLNNRGFRYLERMLVSGALPAEGLTIGFHRYPESGHGPLAPHDRFRNRADEWDTLERIVGSYPVICTEFGYHTADVLDDQEVAASVLWDLAFYDERHVGLAVLYQLNDGPTEAWIDRYGVRRSDGTWKPVADAVRAVYGTRV